MKLSEIKKLLNAKLITEAENDLLDKEYNFAFASDLMSDVLAMIQDGNDPIVLLTGLANAQSIRTAEMLDIKLIIYVRAKNLSDDLIELATDRNITALSTEYTMYETCGILYREGLKPIKYE